MTNTVVTALCLSVLGITVSADPHRTYTWTDQNGDLALKVQENGFTAYIAGREGDDLSTLVITADISGTQMSTEIENDGGAVPNVERIEQSTYCGRDYTVISAKLMQVYDQPTFFYTRFVFNPSDLSLIATVWDDESSSAGGLVPARISKPVFSALNCEVN